MNRPLFIRAALDQVPAYHSARELARTGIFLDANENPFGSVIPSLADVELSRYPDPNAQPVCNAYAQWLVVDAACVLATAGSNDAIDLCCRLSLGPNDCAVILEPTFSLYRTVASWYAADIVQITLPAPFTLDVENLLQTSASMAPKALFICSPNNPTGNAHAPEHILALCRALPHTMIILDEAYVEFSNVPSLATAVMDQPNLVVLRTLSKAWGLAALRVGFMIAHPDTIAWARRMRRPYPVSGLSMALAITGIAQAPRMQALVQQIISAREQLTHDVSQLGCAPWPSQANFVACGVRDVTKFCTTLRAATDIVLRDCSHMPGMPANALRISIGAPEHLATVVAHLAEWQKKL